MCLCEWGGGTSLLTFVCLSGCWGHYLATHLFLFSFIFSVFHVILCAVCLFESCIWVCLCVCSGGKYVCTVCLYICLTVHMVCENPWVCMSDLCCTYIPCEWYGVDVWLAYASPPSECTILCVYTHALVCAPLGLWAAYFVFVLSVVLA